MITEEEARELYNELLAQLRSLKAAPLARDIEVTVLRGTLRTEPVGETRGFAIQTPLSPREALSVALRMLLAALDPIFQVADATKVLRDGVGTQDAATAAIQWAFDRIEPIVGSARDTVTPSIEVLGKIEEMPQIPKSAELRDLAAGLIRLVGELETGG